MRQPVVDRILCSGLSRDTRAVEAFWKCPFKHFSEHTIALQPSGPSQASSSELGRLYHKVLATTADMYRDDNSPDGTAQENLSQKIVLAADHLERGLLNEGGVGRYIKGRAEDDLSSWIFESELAGRFGTFHPRAFAIRFAEHGDLESLRFELDHGASLQLTGTIDRIDATPDGQFACIIDYRASSREATFSLDDIYHGLSLSLPIQLSLLQERHLSNASANLELGQPVAGLLQPVRQPVRRENVGVPSRRIDGSSRFHRPRGIIDGDALPLFDPAFSNHEDDAHAHVKHQSDVIVAETNKDGSLRKTGNDALPSWAFDAVLHHARQKTCEAGNRIVQGDIGVSPFRSGGATACDTCVMKPVCRFDASTNDFRILSTPSRWKKALRSQEEVPLE
jgi:ATP-dependent helicase/nuclease subunit B